MGGILHIAYKLLVNDRAKNAALLVGITFAVFLMIEMTSLFAGILTRSSATVINIGASIWVMDPAIQTVANTIPLPDYVLDEVRSIPGVKYAVPLYSGAALLKLPDGAYQSANIIGLDDTSLFGRPTLDNGNIEDIFAENAFIAVKDSEFYKLENPKVGAEFEMNDHRGVIVGIAHVASSGLFGVPTLYTTYNRALQYIPSTRFTISYLLVEPKTPADVPMIKQQVASAGYLALGAFEQVADSLRALDHDAKSLLAEDESLAVADQALPLIQANYQAGLATYLDVLNADTQCHQAAIAAVQAIAVRYQDTVALFAALGGGWWNAERGDLGAGAPKGN
jgi:hypothetical protein